MTTHRVYKCNLCGDEIKPSPHASKEGFGVHFTAAGASVFKRTFETEHHICHRCAQSVHDELRKRVPAPAAPQSLLSLSETQLRQMHHLEEFGLFCDYDEFEQIARAVEQAHGIKPVKEQTNG